MPFLLLDQMLVHLIVCQLRRLSLKNFHCGEIGGKALVQNPFNHISCSIVDPDLNGRSLKFQPRLSAGPRHEAIRKPVS